MLPPKSRLGGYEVAGLVGRGGMGEVYRARQLSMDREVALKILSPRLARQDPSFAEKFVAEARAAGRLNHPNIVGVHDVGNAAAPEGCHEVAAGETVHYFSMEFIEGETVKDVIERQGAVDTETIARIMAGMAEALGFAEAHKIVHRDIKPDNIMMTSTGLVKLADLGLALQTDSEEAVAGAGKDEQGRSKVMGTPMYMAPEQARAQPVDHRADQYALGATLYHMLTGRPPYTGDSAKAIMRSHCFDPIPDPQEQNPQAAPPWCELCLRLMSKAPDERFATAKELRDAVKQAVRWKPGVRTRTGRGRQQLPVLPIVAVAAVAIAAFWWFVVRAPATPTALPTGTHPTVPHNAGTPNAPAAADPDAEALRRARDAMAKLPADQAAALAAVETLLADASLKAAGSELRARRDALRAALEERHRAPLRATLDAAEADLAAGRLRAARTAQATLPDEDWLRQRVTTLDERLTSAERTIEERITTVIPTADLATCTATVAEIERSELPKRSRSQLLDRIAERQRVLAAKAPPKQQPVRDAKAQWMMLSAKIETLRAAWPYAALQEACTEAARGFPDGERDTVEVLAGISEQAQRVETALRLHISQANPKVEAKLGNRSGTFILTRLEKDWVGFRLPDVPAESRFDRAGAQLPWQQLVSAAMRSQGGADPRAEASFLWYWRLPEATAAMARLGDDPLPQAIAAFERRTRPLEIQGDLTRRDDGTVAVAYPFTRKDPELLRAWRGEGHVQVERGMRWTTTKLTVRNSFNEADLPVLRWNASLRMPCTLETAVHPDGDSETVLIGLSSGGITARIALNHKLRKAFILATNPTDPAQYQALGNKTPVDYAGLEAVRLRLTVDAAGTLQTWVNDKPLATERAIVFPADARLTPVLQGRPVDKSAGLTVAELTFSGKP